MRFPLQSILGATAVLGGAFVSIPSAEVPVSLQTLAVLVVGGCLGRAPALGSILIYLLAALAGLPVLAGWISAPGLSFFELKTCGYLLGFIPGVLIAQRISSSAGWGRQVAWALGAHAVILATGVARLALAIGFEPAIRHGLLPFLLGAAVKSLLAVVAIRAFQSSASRG